VRRAVDTRGSQKGLAPHSQILRLCSPDCDPLLTRIIQLHRTAGIHAPHRTHALAPNFSPTAVSEALHQLDVLNHGAPEASHTCPLPPLFFAKTSASPRKNALVPHLPFSLSALPLLAPCAQLPFCGLRKLCNPDGEGSGPYGAICPSEST